LKLTRSWLPGARRARPHGGGATWKSVPVAASATPLYTSRATGWVKTILRLQVAEPFLLTLMVPVEPDSHSCHSAVWSWHWW